MGGGGFIGNHLVSHLISLGHEVIAADIKYPEFSPTKASYFHKVDLRSLDAVKKALEGCDQLYQLAADMGGAGYIFTGSNDINIMHNSSQINLNVIKVAKESKNLNRILYTSSACIYPDHIQKDPKCSALKEDFAYPAAPDSEYGWEKLYSERLYLTLFKNAGIETRIARLHNIFGPLGTWVGGKEKAPAALSRKVAESEKSIDVWGTGNQTRSFLYIDECIEGLTRLMESDFRWPLNIGSEERISIKDLAKLIIGISGKDLAINFVEGPTGVEGRSSDNELIETALNWSPSCTLKSGLEKTYPWISEQVMAFKAKQSKVK